MNHPAVARYYFRERIIKGAVKPDNSGFHSPFILIMDLWEFESLLLFLYFIHL